MPNAVAKKNVSAAPVIIVTTPPIIHLLVAEAPEQAAAEEAATGHPAVQVVHKQVPVNPRVREEAAAVIHIAPAMIYQHVHRRTVPMPVMLYAIVKLA